MLKRDARVNALMIEQQATEVLAGLLDEVPIIERTKIALRRRPDDTGVDFVAELVASGRPHTLVCQVKANGQPRHARAAVLALKGFMTNSAPQATPVLIAPYLSPKTREICMEAGVGFLDFEGNAHIAFDGIFIDRRVAGAPPAQSRDLKSIFKPKAAQVLRLLLRDPNRRWRVSELSEEANVSLGHVSNVRTSLRDREWATISDGGLSLSEPRQLLEAWRTVYEPPPGERRALYTVLHGTAFDDAIRPALRAASTEGRIIYASFSAARWLAPYARIATNHLYADEAGADVLNRTLDLSPAPRGGNVMVWVTQDDGVFRDAVEPAPGRFCTSAVQTYLDLWAAGERGREAAEHLGREKFAWQM